MVMVWYQYQLKTANDLPYLAWFGDWYQYIFSNGIGPDDNRIGIGNQYDGKMALVLYW